MELTVEKTMHPEINLVSKSLLDFIFVLNNNM